MVIYEGYQIKPHATCPMQYIIVTDGKGGKIPNSLSGVFTSPTRAKEQIDAHLNSKTKE